MTENSLQVLAQKLTRGDEKPDILARRAILDDLLDNELSRWEVRYLRDRVNAMPQALDIFMNLPIEIFLMTVALLDLEELITARAVSHAWRQRFASLDVSLAIIKKHFRTTWEKSYNSLTGRDQELAQDLLCEALPAAITKRLRRQHYKCRSWKFFPKGPQKPLYIVNRDGFQYNNGRVAFLLPHRAIGVQAIDGNGPVESVKDPDREDIFRWILSDQYLIATSSASHPAVIAWDRELNLVARVRLPSTAFNLSAHGSRVGIITHTREALVWHVGGSLVLLDTSAGHQSFGEGYHHYIHHVLFSPSDDDITFVVHNGWLIPPNNKWVFGLKMKLVVEVFVRGQHKRSHYSEHIHYPTRNGLVTGEAVADYIDFSHIDSHAIVSKDGICSLWQGVRYHSVGSSQSSPDDTIYVELDLYEAQKCSGDCTVVTHPRSPPDFPVGVVNQRTIHGREVIVRRAPWVDHPDPTSLVTMGRKLVLADENFVVVCGHDNFAVGYF